MKKGEVLYFCYVRDYYHALTREGGLCGAWASGMRGGQRKVELGTSAYVINPTRMQYILRTLSRSLSCDSLHRSLPPCAVAGVISVCMIEG
jgi:hypothetical protein